MITVGTPIQDNADTMLTIVGENGEMISLPCPSKFEYGLQDVSASDAGRTLDGNMDKNRIAQKRKLQCEWAAKNPTVTSFILKAVNPEYIEVIYPDFMEGEYQQRTFYIGDRSAEVVCWWDGNQLIETIKFDFVEK